MNILSAWLVTTCRWKPCRAHLLFNIMNRQTLNALKDSIAHWKRLSTNTHKKNETPYYEHCALCLLFNRNAIHVGCLGCPVSEKTGHGQCAYTPWRDTGEHWYGTKHIQSTEFLRAAKKQLTFLKGLLPKRKTKREIIKCLHCDGYGFRVLPSDSNRYGCFHCNGTGKKVRKTK